MIMDNSENRLIDVFLYGLHMDPELLEEKGVEPRNPRKGIAKGFRLHVGKQATMLRELGSEAHGVIYSLTHDEIQKLYWNTGLDTYVPEALLVEIERYKTVPVLCCNLLVPPEEEESNPEYLHNLRQCMDKLGLPTPSIQQQ